MPANVTTTPALADLDGLGFGDAAAWRARLRRVAPFAVVAVVLAGLAFALGGPGRVFTDALGRALDADPGWVVAAVAFEILSFGGYSLLLWHVAGRGGSRLSLMTSAQLTLAGAAATRLLPTAGAGGAALTLWGLRRAGHRGRDGVRTLLTFLVVLYAVFLAGLVVAGALVASGAVPADGPSALGAVPAVLASAAIAGALALGLRRPGVAGAPAPGHRARARRGAAVLGEAVRDALVLVRGADPRLLGALAWWAFDVGVLWALFNAFGWSPPVVVLVLAYLVGQVANTLPLPGAVSGGTVGVLIAFGAPAGTASPRSSPTGRSPSGSRPSSASRPCPGCAAHRRAGRARSRPRARFGSSRRHGERP